MVELCSEAASQLLFSQIRTDPETDASLVQGQI